MPKSALVEGGWRMHVSQERGKRRGAGQDISIQADGNVNIDVAAHTNESYPRYSCISRMTDPTSLGMEMREAGSGGNR